MSGLEEQLSKASRVDFAEHQGMYAYLNPNAVRMPLPIESIEVQFATADYWQGKASLSVTLEASAKDNDPITLLWCTHDFFREFVVALCKGDTLGHWVPILTNPSGTLLRVRECITHAQQAAIHISTSNSLDTYIVPTKILVIPRPTAMLIAAQWHGGAIADLFSLPRSKKFFREFTAAMNRASNLISRTLQYMFEEGRKGDREKAQALLNPLQLPWSKDRIT